MAKKKVEPCPCGFQPASSSGRTLHMKKCCPDQMHLQTRVRMTVEFTVGGDVSQLGAIKMFKACWGAWKNTGGYANLKFADVHNAEVGPRGLSPIEKKKKLQAATNKERRLASAEIRAVIDESVGKRLMEEKWKNIKTIAVSWPDELRWDFEPYIRQSRALDAGVRLRFHTSTTCLYISRSLSPHRYHRFGPDIKINLADPECFEQIRKACLGGFVDD